MPWISTIVDEKQLRRNWIKTNVFIGFDFVINSTPQSNCSTEIVGYDILEKNFVSDTYFFNLFVT